jgi:hypothetical protein
MTIFDPVGIVHAVFAAFGEAGFVTRSVRGSKRGSLELLDGADRGPVELDDDDDVDDDPALLSSLNWIC